MQAWKQVSNSIDPFPAGGDGDPVLRAEVADVAEWQWPNTRLMRCCAKLDRRTEAIGAYRRLRRTLSVTLGPHPSASSEKPYQSLRAGDTVTQPGSVCRRRRLEGSSMYRAVEDSLEI